MRGARVLAVEDMKGMGQLIEILFGRERNDQVKIVSGGEAALSACGLADPPPDLVFLLWWYVGMGVDEFCPRLHAIPGCEEIPVLVMGSPDALRFAQRVRDAGGHGYLMAPVLDIREMVRARDALLAGELYFPDA